MRKNSHPRWHWHWRWVIARAKVGVLVAFGFAWYFYPHLLHWWFLGAVIIGGAQTWALLAIWRRFGPQLRQSGFKW